METNDMQNLRPTVAASDLPSFEGLLADHGIKTLSHDYRELFANEARMFRKYDGTVIAFRHNDLRTLGANPVVTNIPLERFMDFSFGGPREQPLQPHESDQIRRFQSVQFFSANDAEQHRQMKPVFARPLLAREMTPYASVAGRLASALFAKHGDGVQFDLFADFGVRLGFDFWAEILRMTEAEVAALEQVMSGMAPVAVPGARSRDALVELNDTIPKYFDVLTGAMARIRAEGKGHILNAIADEFGRPEKNMALLAHSPEVFMASNMVDGFHAMGISIATTLFHLAEAPAAVAALRANPELAEIAVNEALRLNSPVAAINRYVSEDTNFEGIQLPKGTIMMLHWAAGNRDPSVHDNPNVYDINRPQKPLLTFGGGAQLCPGRNLARALGSEAVKQFLASGLALRLAGEVEWLPDRDVISRQHPVSTAAKLTAQASR